MTPLLHKALLLLVATTALLKLAPTGGTAAPADPASAPAAVPSVSPTHRCGFASECVGFLRRSPCAQPADEALRRTWHIPKEMHLCMRCRWDSMR